MNKEKNLFIFSVSTILMKNFMMIQLRWYAEFGRG